MKYKLILYIFYFFLIGLCNGLQPLLKTLFNRKNIIKFKKKPRLRKDYLCQRSEYNLGMILKTFLSTSSRPIEKWNNISKVDFCEYCRYNVHFNNKYKHYKKRDSDNKLLKDLDIIVSTLDRECSYTWDYGSRGLNKDKSLKWVENFFNNKFEVNVMKNCSHKLGKISFSHSYSGSHKLAYMTAKASKITQDKMTSIGLALVHEAYKHKYIKTCFDYINLLSHFRPDVCSGILGSILHNQCPESCRLIEGRIVQTTFKDCCDDCLNVNLDIIDKLKDKIDYLPGESVEYQ